MFDISWKDPAREVLGQWKTQDESTVGPSRASSLRSQSSRSTESIKTTKQSIFGFLASKKTALPRAESAPKLSSLADSSRRTSSYTAVSEASSQGLQEMYPRTSARLPPGSTLIRNSYADSESHPSDDSTRSGGTERSAATTSSWASSTDRDKTRVIKRVQPLGSDSFVSQSTEVTSRRFRPSESLANVVEITSSGTMPIQLPDSPTRGSYTSFEFPVPGTHLPKLPIASTSKPTCDKASTGYPSVRAPIIAPAGKRINENGLRRNDPWKPPETWECPLEPSPPKLALLPAELRRKKAKCRGLTSVEYMQLQKTVRKMEAATPKIILDRLKEEWDEVPDASIYRELELEKQLWMLTALRMIPRKNKKSDVMPTGSVKILSLYENHASASLLSAHNPTPPIHHLSPNPLSAKSYPNVHPFSIPNPTSKLPYASNLFTSIHAFSLPSLLPASSIPALLAECHRTLVSPSTPVPPPIFPTTSISPFAPPRPPSVKAGILHLTLLDPSPTPSTLGPLLRAWLEAHLLIQLERQFRCINPCRLFPVWLADAGLRGDGSVVSNLSFKACVGPGCGVGEELRCVMGRGVWKELWGGFVEGGKWWWDDVEILKECRALGTVWEGGVVEAVKSG